MLRLYGYLLLIYLKVLPRYFYFKDCGFLVYISDRFVLEFGYYKLQLELMFDFIDFEEKHYLLSKMSIECKSESKYYLSLY